MNNSITKTTILTLFVLCLTITFSWAQDSLKNNLDSSITKNTKVVADSNGNQTKTTQEANNNENVVASNNNSQKDTNANPIASANKINKINTNPSNNINPAPKKTAIIVTLEETVDPGMAVYTKRAIKEAAAHNPDYIIFEVNTFGGELMAAFEIVDEISALKIPTIALVNKKAISAGALISLSAGTVYMRPMTTIGDCAPITQGSDGPNMLGEKIQSPLRAKFRNLSQKNGFPELLGQAMVSIDLEIVKIQKGDSTKFLKAHEYAELTDIEKKGWSSAKTIVREGELLTLTNNEAEKFGFSAGTVEDLDALIKELNLTIQKDIEVSWAEKLARLLRTITPILTMLGFGAIYMEFKTPGFGFFGVTGIILLSLAFGGQSLANVTTELPLVLMIIGMLLVVVEIIILPGTMIAGISGAAFMGVALVLVIKDASVLPTPGMPVVIGPDGISGNTNGLSKAVFMVVSSAVTAIIFPILSTRYILPHLPEKFSMMLKTTLKDAHISRIDSTTIKIGDIGNTASDLKPTGKAHFITENGKELIEVQSKNKFIDKGQTVKVIATNGNFITVDLEKGND